MEGLDRGTRRRQHPFRRPDTARRKSDSSSLLFRKLSLSSGLLLLLTPATACPLVRPSPPPTFSSSGCRPWRRIRAAQTRGLGPSSRRFTETGGMSSAAGGGGDGEGPLPFVLGLPVALPQRDAVSRMDAGVPRKARTGRQFPRPPPAGWLAFRLPVPPPVKAEKPPAAKAKKPPPAKARPVLGLLAPSLPDLGAAAAAPDMEKPAKKARICVQCGSAETPQWRSGPMGRSTLCNACGVRLRAAGALRETQPSPRDAVETPPAPAPKQEPESPASDSSPDSPILQRLAPLEDVYLVRKPPARERRPPRKDSSSPAPSPPPSPAVYLVKKKKPSKKKCRPRNTGQKCLHCGTTSTPQWREGPMGRHTLCNACGVRWRQGRLLPEYRPAASPTFKASEHASRHRDVLQLHRLQQGSQQQLEPVVVDGGKSGDAPGSDIEDDKKNVFLVRRERPVKEYYPPTPLHQPLLLQPVNDDDDPRVGGNKDSAAGTEAAGRGGGGGDDAALDLLLGPSAPLIVDGDDFLVR
ncbi:hypothetical protein EJB05_02435, partial [Eragrostis curvula]